MFDTRSGTAEIQRYRSRFYRGLAWRAADPLVWPLISSDPSMTGVDVQPCQISCDGHPWREMSGLPQGRQSVGGRQPDHVSELARRRVMAPTGRCFTDVSLAACAAASISSRACRSRAVLTSRRSASAPMIVRAARSVMSALVSALDLVGWNRVCSVMTLLMPFVSADLRKAKKAGRTRPLLGASMISASTSVVNDQRRSLATQPEGSRPRSCHCDCLSRGRS
jgi:hypothetical protein